MGSEAAAWPSPAVIVSGSPELSRPVARTPPLPFPSRNGIEPSKSPGLPGSSARPRGSTSSVIRDRIGLQRGLGKLDAIEAELLATGIADGARAFNLTWHDWLNLRSLVETSRVITLAALQRENSRGAHFREDFPEPGDLASSTYTVARQRAGRIAITDEPVRFTIVRPGETLLREAAE